MYKMRFSLPIACLLLAIVPSLKQETVFAYNTEAVVSPLVLYGDVYGFGGMPSTPWRTLGTATTSLTVTVVPEDSQTFPDTEEEVEMLFSKERTNLKKEEIKQIVEIVNRHKK